MVNYCLEKGEGRVNFYLGGVNFHSEGEGRDGGEGGGGKGEGVLFVFYFVQRNASPVLERLCLENSKKGKGQGKGSASLSHLQPKRKNTHSDKGRPPSPSEKFTNQEDINEMTISQLVVSSRYLCLPPITTLSTLLQPFLDGRSAQKHCNSQPLTTRQKKIRKAPLASDRGTTRPTKKVMAKPPYTAARTMRQRNTT